MSHLRTTPFRDRIEADRAITPHLLAAYAHSSVDLAELMAELWFSAVADLCQEGLVLVFDEFAVGAPGPLLLETADQVRVTRQALIEVGRADEAGPDDDESTTGDHVAWWYIPDLVLAAVGDWSDANRIVSGRRVLERVAERFDPDCDDVDTEVRLLRGLELFVLIFHDDLRIGCAAIVDGRPTAERLWERAS